ncbi:MAG: hypothetical protein BWY85_02231 [Firmicutes bacterium ADurb.Bin506]|nr:MAG: hypothetical protein BWY85_02231 [Firmicutes bacterium ADurb.Bin506]
MPAARAMKARRAMESSTSFWATIIRSASSSTMTTMYGSGFAAGSLPSAGSASARRGPTSFLSPLSLPELRAPPPRPPGPPAAESSSSSSRKASREPDSTISLYCDMFLAPASWNSLYLPSISSTTHLRKPDAFFGSVTTGARRCGMPSYTDSSTRFGSIIRRRTSLGAALNSMLQIMELRHTLFPEPVAPATSRCSILLRSPTTAAPAMSLPRPIVRRDSGLWNSSDSRTSRR